MKMYSLSEEGYKFYDAISNIAGSGGRSEKIPNIPTNIQGWCLRYFGASAVSTKSP